jgi:hypothetical protein
VSGLLIIVGLESEGTAFKARGIPAWRRVKGVLPYFLRPFTEMLVEQGPVEALSQGCLSGRPPNSRPLSETTVRIWMPCSSKKGRSRLLQVHGILINWTGKLLGGKAGAPGCT